jgi:hypothetical protein
MGHRDKHENFQQIQCNMWVTHFVLLAWMLFIDHIDQRLALVSNYHENQADNSNISNNLGYVHSKSRWHRTYEEGKNEIIRWENKSVQ